MCNFRNIGLLQRDLTPSKLMIYTLNYFLLSLNVSKLTINLDYVFTVEIVGN